MEGEGFFSSTLLFFMIIGATFGAIIGKQTKLESKEWDSRLLERALWLFVGVVLGLAVPIILKLLTWGTT